MQADDTDDIDAVIPIDNLIEYSDNYSETFKILWQLYRDESNLASNGDITDFNEGNVDTNSFKIKERVTGHTSNNGTKHVKIMTPLKALSKFWTTFEMPLI